MSKDEDIFNEAIKNSINEALKKQEHKEESNENSENSNELLSIQHTEEGDKWDNLAKYVNGDGADRLVKSLQGMGDRDFVRNYLKLLEHFKPKLTRSDNLPEDEGNRTITIELVQQLPTGEKRTITLNNRKNNE